MSKMREGLRRILNRLTVTIGLPLILIVAAAAGLSFFDLESAHKLAAWWFLVAVIIFVAVLTTGQLLTTDTKRLHQRIQKDLRTSQATITEDVKRIIQENIDPLVTVLRTIAEVRLAAAKLLEEALQSKGILEVTYFGSASLTPSEKEFRNATQSDDWELSDVYRYQSAIDELKNSETAVVRFIRLLDDGLFGLRDAETRLQYLAWLQAQVTRLKVSANYTIFDTRRAPEWGGAISTILTPRGKLDIIGDGKAGLLLVSARIPVMFLEESKRHFWAAKREKNKPEPYTAAQSSKLQARVEALKKLHQELLILEAETGSVRRIK
jgi:hypothetical protein